MENKKILKFLKIILYFFKIIYNFKRIKNKNKFKFNLFSSIIKYYLLTRLETRAKEFSI